MFQKEVQSPKYIDIKIKRISQLFNSFDPSPFLEKDLDDDAFEYIVSSVSEHHRKTHQKIRIHLPKREMRKTSEEEIKRAVRNYFEYKKLLAEKSIRLELKEGQFSFIVGISFLSTVFILRNILLDISDSVAMHVFAEGLIIGGWVAMWKPISNILYDWWPLHYEKQIYEKISTMDIEFMYG